MAPHESLHDRLPGFDAAPRGLPLIILLSGFRDSGAVVGQLAALLAEGTTETLASFDADELIDYRARRPTALIDEGRLLDVAMPRLELRLGHDELGAPFLLLAGHEPDFRWARFADEVTGLVAALGASSTTWIHALPMPVPHTRPIPIAATGNRSELVEAISVWSPRTEAPAHVGHLLEHRLAERGHPVLGLALLVPHYIAESVVPGAALAALSALGTATDLILPADQLRELDREFTRGVDEQVAEREEVVQLIEALERQHDAYLENLGAEGALVDENGDLPSADEIAAELERFLARRRERGGDEE